MISSVSITVGRRPVRPVNLETGIERPVVWSSENGKEGIMRSKLEAV